MRYGFVGFLLLSWGCTLNSIPSDVFVETGQEADVWGASPSVQTVRAELVVAGARRVLAETTAPATGIPFDPVPDVRYGTIGTFEITGLDASGAPAVHGVTVPFSLSSLEGVAVPVFTARAGGFARPRGALEHPHRHAVTVVALHQYLFAAGGDAPAGNPAVPDLYDAAAWTTLTGQPAFPRVPKSLVEVKAALLSIDDRGATWLNLTNDDTRDPEPPSGLTFAEVSGGATLALSDGTRYVVGATRREGDATEKVLRIDADGHFSAVLLATRRLGAAAVVLDDTVLVVGGAATGSGVEVLRSGETASTPLDFPPETGKDLALVPLPAAGNAMLVSRAEDGTPLPLRTVDRSCAASCSFAALGVASPDLTQTLAVALPNTSDSSAQAPASGRAILVGETADGETHAYQLDASALPPTLTEKPFRVRRKGASATVLPNGQVAIVGGAAIDSEAAVSSLEAYFP